MTSTNKKTHKKSISTKIKKNILNIDQHISQAKRRNEYNNMFKSHCYNDEDVNWGGGKNDKGQVGWDQAVEDWDRAH